MSEKDEGWRQSDLLKRVAQAKENGGDEQHPGKSKRCSQCAYWGNALAGRAKSPECQRLILMNREIDCREGEPYPGANADKALSQEIERLRSIKKQTKYQRKKLGRLEEQQLKSDEVMKHERSSKKH